MKTYLLALATTVLNTAAPAQESPQASGLDSLELSALQQEFSEMVSIDSSFTYKYGLVDIANGMATISIPEGFKFLDAKQSQYVLTDLWGNPPDESTLGMLFRQEDSPVMGMLYAIEISYTEEGYIEDEDATELDYDELLETLKGDSQAENQMRLEQGYPALQLMGWAVQPYYDAEAKKLHWAKELSFEGEEVNTLNYNIRILGRRGYLMLNAISDMDALDSINTDLPPILASVNFNEGHRYRDFDSSIDKVAAYGIGGLIAGKILSKAGLFAVLAKFWKVIALGIAGLFGIFRKRLFGSSDV